MSRATRSTTPTLQRLNRSVRLGEVRQPACSMEVRLLPVGSPQGGERAFMMNYAYGWMGGMMWIWTLICILVVVLLVVVINRVSSK